MTTTTQSQSVSAVIKNYIKDFGVLKDNKRSYWSVQAVNILDCIAYYCMITTLMMFLTDNVGLSDEFSGYTVTAYGITVSLTLIIAGFLTDTFGLRKATFVGIGLQTISRIGILALGLSPDFAFREVLIVLLIIMAAPGQAMMQAVFQAGTKLFSSERSRSASFNIWYLLMNLGFALGGMSVDVIRKSLGLDLSYVFALGAITGILSIIVGFSIVKKADQTDEPEQHQEKKEGGFKAFKNLVQQSPFRRLLALMGVLLGVRSVFLYTFMLMPLYWQRTIEASSGAVTDQGLLQSINPAMIFIGVFLFIPLANKWKMFNMLIGGAFISALAMSFLILPWNWFGGTLAEGYFMMSVIFMVLLSLGEIIWSPKLYEYIGAIAPKGQEGAYLGMGMVPWFVAKTIVGILAGHMLTRWVPEGVHTQIEAGTLPFWDSPEAMWLVLFAWAITGLLIAWFCRGWFTKGTSVEKQEQASAEVATA